MPTTPQPKTNNTKYTDLQSADQMQKNIPGENTV